jgi:L-fuconolactonase
MAETHWLLELANKYDFIAGVVGWVDLQDPDIEIHLKELASDPKFKGVRHLVQDESSDDWLTRPEVLRGLRCLSKYDLAYDLLVFTRHLPFAKKTVQQLPDQRFVIDHLAKPPISQRKIAEWRSALSEIAAFPNVLCKLSGLVTEADHDSWCPDDVHPYVETALDLFGPDRLMFGSDYPVCLLAASYSEVFDTYKSFLEHLNQEERSRVLFHNAVDFYRL